MFGLQRLAASDFATGEQGHFLRYFLLTMMVLLAGYLGLLSVIVQSPSSVLSTQYIEIGVVVFLAGVLKLCTPVKTTWVAQLLILSLYISFSKIALLTGGIYSIAICWLILLPTATLLLGRIATLFWLTVTVAVLTVFAGLEVTHWYPVGKVSAAPFSAWAAGVVVGSSFIFVIHTLLYEMINNVHIRNLLNQKNILITAQKELLKTQSHKDEFIAVVSHELRTPMNAVLGFAALLREHVQQPSQTMIDYIQSSANQLLRIITDILDFSQLQANKVVLNKNWVNPLRLLDELNQHFIEQVQIEDKKINIVTRVRGEMPAAVWIDKERIFQAIDQVLRNAIRFSDKGQVYVTLFADGNEWVLEVQDEGIGIETHELSNIFSGFQHANREVQQRYGGTGLGLAICKKIVDLHGGALYVSSELGIGSVFTIRLPLNPAAIKTAHPSSLPLKHLTRSEKNAFLTRFQQQWMRFQNDVMKIIEDRPKVYAMLLAFDGIVMFYLYWIAPFEEARQVTLLSCVGMFVLIVLLKQPKIVKLLPTMVQLITGLGIAHICLASGGVFSPVISWIISILLTPLYLGKSASRVFWLCAMIAETVALAYVTEHHMLRIEPDRFQFDLRWTYSGYLILLMLLCSVPLVFKLIRNNLKNELILKNNELLEIKQNLIDQQRIKDQFIATISHALRTPMNSILGFNDLLRDEVRLGTPAHELHGLVAQASKHLLTVINDMLDHSQMASGQLKLHQSPFDLRKTIKNVFQMFHTSCQGSDIELRLELGDIPHWVIGDSQRLNQILVNLLNNAVKFTPQGRVWLKVHAVQGAVRFEIEDTGVGIPADKLQHIFDQFEQVEGAHQRLRGHGLGLAITKRLIEEQQGWIHVTSTPQQGSVFQFEIKFEACAPLGGEIDPHESIRTEQSPIHILIVDDQSLNRLLVKQVLLRTWPEAQLLEAIDGIDALAQLENQAVDLILMDVLMPEMDGMTATHHVRTHRSEKVRRIPILGLTANAYESTRQHCLEAGMNEVIYKPFSRETLVEQIEKLLCETC